MNKTRKILYGILIAGTGIFFLVILLFSKKTDTTPQGFVEPKGTYALSAEWINAKASIEGLLVKVNDNPKDYKSMLALTQAYIQEGRTTGNHAFYDKAALDLTDKILANDTANFEALCCKATVLLSQHHFMDGLIIAEQAQNINPYSAFIYGLLCDADVELGRYDDAVKMADKMISIRPDLRSYSRVSYLREIYGDMRGSIDAMKLAVSAGYPGLEQTEWARIILAHLYLSIGNLDSAEFEYRTALLDRPDYPFAIAGLGKIAKARGNYKEAITDYEKATTLITEFSFYDELTDLYLLNNEKDKSEKTAQQVIEMLSPGKNTGGTNGHGHYADKELAYAFLKTNQVDSALSHAITEYNRRPDNIDVCETVAWALYKKGYFYAANTTMNKALRTGSKNPILLCRAGLIKTKAGEKEAGISLIKTAFSYNPFLDVELKKEAQPYLSSN
jgi:tetratricopeptide (TPR) repeat protein